MDKIQIEGSRALPEIHLSSGESYDVDILTWWREAQRKAGMDKLSESLAPMSLEEIEARMAALNDSVKWAALKENQEEKTLRLLKLFEQLPKGDKDQKGKPLSLRGLFKKMATWNEPIYRVKSPSWMPCTSKPKRPRFQANLLRVWELFPFILGRKTKQDVFEPLYEEFKEDYLLARRFKTKGAKRWLDVCFLWKTVAMIVGCFRVMVGAKVIKLLLGFLPASVKRLFSA